MLNDPSGFVLKDEIEPLLEVKPSSIQNSVDSAESRVSHDGLPLHPSVHEIVLSTGTLPKGAHLGPQAFDTSSVVTSPLYEDTYSMLAA